MALRGNLRDFSLPDVFQLVQLSKKTGVLRIAGTDSEGTIWFRDGDVFFAQSNWRREPLGERLVSAQRITPSALKKALEVYASEPRDGRRLGRILVDEGYITEHVLETFVQEQIQDTIFDLMRWDEGEFDFEVLPEVVHEDIGLSVSVENIVMEGARRLEEWNRIKKKVPSTTMVFKMATAPGEGTFEISLKPVEWNLLLLVDGTRTVAEIAKETGHTDFEVARIIYGLFSAGLLEVPSDEEVERLRAERARREDKRATIDASRTARDEAQKAEALDLEARLAAEAEARLGVGEKPSKGVPAADLAAAARAKKKAAPAEEPQFLSSQAAEPSVEDMAVFEQMMEAVLQPHGEPGPAVAPEPVPESPFETSFETPLVPSAPSAELEVPVESSAAEPGYGAGISEVDLAEIPAPPVSETYAPPEGFVPSGDLETDLRMLGLGEFPPELAEQAVPEVPAEQAATVETAPEEFPAYQEAPAIEAYAQVATPAAEAESVEDRLTPEEDADLDSLLRGLGAEPTGPTGVISSDVDYGGDQQSTSGYISTDAFLAEFDSDVGLSSGLGDELTALTGGGSGRTRPQATVAKIPEPGGVVLKRDQMVDRALLERIIEGIENL